MLEFLKRALPWLLAGLIFAFGMKLGSDNANAKWEEKVNHEYVTKVEATRRTQVSLNEISKRYQDDLAALEGSTDRVIDDLRKSNKRLSVRVSATGTATTDGRCIFNGRAELDEATSRRLIGITQRGDLQIKTLQDTIRRFQNQQGGAK